MRPLSLKHEPPPEPEDPKLLAFCQLLEEHQLFTRPEPQRLHRNPLRYPDVWLNLLALSTLIATTSSLYPRAMIEPLLYSAIFATIFALVFRLTADTPLRDHEPQSNRSSVLGGFWKPHQQKAGIRPVE